MKPCINSLAQSSHGIGFFPNKDFKENRICRFCHKVFQATRAQPSSDSALREGGERDWLLCLLWPHQLLPCESLKSHLEIPIYPSKEWTDSKPFQHFGEVVVSAQPCFGSEKSPDQSTDVFFPNFSALEYFFPPLWKLWARSGCAAHPQMFVCRGWLIVSGAVTEMCGSQMSFDRFEELLHSWHKVLPLQGVGERGFCQSRRAVGAGTRFGIGISDRSDLEHWFCEKMLLWISCKKLPPPHEY